MLTQIQKLKLSLLTSGITISDSVFKQLSLTNKPHPLTIADYASTSGIALQLQENIWVNAPIAAHNPNFVKKTPHTLEVINNNFVINSEKSYFDASLIPVPSYASLSDGEGNVYADYGLTHTDRVRISPISGCVGGCEFCDMHSRASYQKKDITKLIKTINLSLNDAFLPAKHILISGGTPKKEDFSYLNHVYDEVLNAFPHIRTDIMMTPLPGLLDIKHLAQCGLHGLSINLEIYDAAVARKLMPLKSLIPQVDWFKFLEEAVNVLGTGRVRSLLIVGLESMENTLKGVQALAERGCEPVLSPFRPDPSTKLKNVPPPSVEFLIEAYEKAVEIANKYDSKLGPSCIPCQHNTITFPDESGYYHYN